MKKLLFFCVALCSVTFIFAAGGKETKAESGEVFGDTGLVIPKTVPQRTVTGTIVTLDMLDYLDVPVAGLPTTRRPVKEKYQSKPRIGNPMQPDMEQVRVIKPDFYVTASASPLFVEQLAEAGIPAAVLPTNTLEGFLQSMAYLGKVYHKEAKAKAYVDAVQKKLAEIKAKNKGKPEPKVLVLFGTPGGMMFATDQSFTGNLVKAIGGQNTWTGANVPSGYAPINLEMIKNSNPDVIVRLSHVAPELSRKMFAKEFTNDFWTSLKAVKNGRVYDLDNENFAVVGNINIVKALDILDNFIYQQ